MKKLIALLVFTISLPAQDGLKLAIAPKADVKSGTGVPFEVTVKDAKGAPVDGATVQVVATMVEMDHGEFKYEAKPVKQGVYRVTPNFMMGGAWNLAVRAKKGSAEATMNQKIDVKD